MIPIESDFQSALAPLLRDFVLEKRAVGYLYVTEQYLLRRLDRQLIEHGHGTATLPKPLLATWLGRAVHESAKTQSARGRVVRQLARFLRRNGVVVELPASSPRALPSTRFVARIFVSVARNRGLPRLSAPTQARAHEDERGKVVGAGERLGCERSVGAVVRGAAGRVGGVVAMVEGGAGAAKSARAAATLAWTRPASSARCAREGGARGRGGPVFDGGDHPGRRDHHRTGEDPRRA